MNVLQLSLQPSQLLLRPGLVLELSIDQLQDIPLGELLLEGLMLRHLEERLVDHDEIVAFHLLLQGAAFSFPGAWLSSEELTKTLPGSPDEIKLWAPQGVCRFL